MTDSEFDKKIRYGLIVACSRCSEKAEDGSAACTGCPVSEAYKTLNERTGDEEVRRQFGALRERFAVLKIENARLRKEAEYWKEKYEETKC